MNKINVLELFGGIGACTAALKRLEIDFKVVDYVEIDKYAVASYNAINNTNFEPQDITQWDKDLQVDLIMHGSPCQDFSIAGKQAGGDQGTGTRSSLMYETIRIVTKLKPKYVIWENVKNLLSKKHRHNFDAYLETMENLGYTNYYQVLNAKDYGIPQNRERVFTISVLENQDFKFPPKQELKLKLKDMLEDEVDEKYYLSNDKIEMISKWNSYEKPFKNILGKNSVIGTLTTRSGAECGGMKVYSNELDETTNLQNECLNINNTNLFTETQEKMFTEDGNVKRYINSNIVDKFNEGGCADISFPNGYGKGKRTHDDICVTLANASIKSIVTKVAPKEENELNLPGAYGRNFGSKGKLQKQDDVCDTLQAAMGTGGGNIPLINNLRIRKLTPKECWRLMGFKDENFEKAAKINSNSQLYKQAGNSIVVNVLEAILTNLFEK